jgi:hypothetical protein
LAALRKSPDFEKAIASRDSLVGEKLVGTWRDAGEGRGVVTKTIVLEKDGSYAFEYADGKGLSHRGTWKISDGQLLLAAIEERAQGGSGNEGYATLSKPKAIRMQLSRIEYQPPGYWQGYSILIDNARFWH